MKRSRKLPSSSRERLAKDFCTAYIANHLGITFRTAQNYVDDEIGEFWLLLADMVIKANSENMSELLAGHFKEPEAVSELEN